MLGKRTETWFQNESDELGGLFLNGIYGKHALSPPEVAVNMHVPKQVEAGPEGVPLKPCGSLWIHWLLFVWV